MRLLPINSNMPSLNEVYRTHDSTRRKALDKLAALCARTTGSEDGEEHIERFCALQRPSKVVNGLLERTNTTLPTSAIPMSVRESEVLVALCKAAPLVQTGKDAAKLLNQLAPYVPEAHKQTLKCSLLHQPSPPWEMLAYELTSAILALALNHPALREQALACIDHTVEELTNSAESAIWIKSSTADGSDPDSAERSLPAIKLTVSLLGFLEAIAQYVQVWTPERRLTLIQRMRYLLSEKFMISLEGALSAIRNSRSATKPVKEWKRWVHHYAVTSRPLGAMLLQQAFMQVVEEIAKLLVNAAGPFTHSQLLDTLLQRTPVVDQVDLAAMPGILEGLAECIAEEMNLLEDDADYLQVSSAWQQRLALEVKSSSLRSFLCCTLLDEEVADGDLLMAWLDGAANDPGQMADDAMAQTVLKSMAVLARTSPTIAANLTRSLPRLIVQGKMTARTAALAGECLAGVLKHTSEDVVISTLYSLGNVLSAKNNAENASGMSPFFDGNGSINSIAFPYQSQPVIGSAVSLAISDEEDTATRYGAVVQAIVAIACAYNEEQMTALVISMLVQKVGRVSSAVDARIITEMASLGLCGGPNEIRAILRLYARISSEATINNDILLIDAVLEGRIRLASWVSKSSPLYEVCLTHFLTLCVGSGDSAGERIVDIALTSRLISQLFRPMAVLLSSDPDRQPDFSDTEELLMLTRNAWFNIVVHGYTLSSINSVTLKELQILAQYTLPLVDEDRIDMPESGIDLNTVLRRGASGQHTVEQKASLIASCPQCEPDIKGLSYPDSVFLNTALLVTNLRARAGDCTAALPYFMESKVKTTAMGNCMLAIALLGVDTYIECAVSAVQERFAAPQVALQLSTLFEGCCHRISKVQHAAVSMADRMMNSIPSALCQKASLFALLELLSLMWKSCLDCEIDEYDLKPTYQSRKGNVQIQLSDDVQFRQTTLANFQKRCELWVSKAIDIAPLDVKGLLQAYLEDYEDDGSYGHIALGRSFALRMGSMIPNTDQRLMSLDHQSVVGVNTASDFIAQYTTRQEYKHLNNRSSQENDWTLVSSKGTAGVDLVEPLVPILDEEMELVMLTQRLRAHEKVQFSIVREALRNAAGVLSRNTADRASLLQDLVAIPFIIFTKQSINLGISLWLGIVKENPSLETRILVEVAAGWARSIRLKKGIFSTSIPYLDPFYIKEEFAPSKWETISKRQQVVHGLIDPHLRLTHYLSSHFSSSRLTSSSVERVYSRLMRITMLAMKHTVTQPLAREVHFHVVLLGLKVLKYCTTLDQPAKWRLKDAALSAGLAWFVRPPCWSFGSNRLQVKAEVKLMGDVIVSLQSSSATGARSTRSLPSLQSKQELLIQLLRHDMERLAVWISPLASDSKSFSYMQHNNSAVRDTTFTSLLGAAWSDDPRIVVQLACRFPKAERLQFDVRHYIMHAAAEVIDEPDALNVMLGSALPSDVQTQLRYLLYWAPINPMAAVTYFMPGYRNHPLIIQYAMRALESHSVDVTFFYVPQIVQALRYDALGYVERYIIETAKFSQLFAHQIIWNMKANSYKDDDSQEPDPVKPVLDKVMDSLIRSFSAEDRSFYEREFDFFGKVTGISGTLKPFIKRPKPEKKQKIEEELRKIQVEVGVYLPSNPDGVVIGIDRKSGKPLQSHAKAPYMATFRIRKEENQTETLENRMSTNGDVAKRQTYEVWQSAIFKVGDDCRQDVLALQLVAAFRGIFNSVGLDVYVFPYRVTATAPGCGVIDVLPNSISRDMLGREAVNGLYEYFVSKYGSEDSIRFQKARSNFIKSMAAYSIISYLLQFKDRHNGNIMVDDAGHILHIDFGFLFDIAPGGVKFERAPFKLTPEMVAVMGGSTHSQSFRCFEELCVKAFLASRQYVDQLGHIILAMLDSGLPCFKPATIQHFKERFVLEKTDREAADFVRKLVHWSERSYSTGVYDYFQLLTNGIPY